MGGKSPNSVWTSIQLSREEKEVLKAAAKREGIKINTLIRRWIATLAERERGGS